jgi:ankyrin repeat protein
MHAHDMRYSESRVRSLAAPMLALAGIVVAAVSGCSGGQRLLNLHYWEPCGEEAARLAAAGADLGVTDDMGRTPLHLAATWGNLDAARAFVEHGASLDKRDQSGRTPLFAAVDESEVIGQWPGSNIFPDHEGQARIIELLVGHGADLEARDQNGDTPLQWAAECQSHDKLDVLIRLGADLNVTDPFGNTPLHELARKAAPATVRLLVEHGANLNARNELGLTPLHVAATRSLFADEVYQMMIEHGADPDARDNRGKTPAELLEQNRRVPTP